MPHNVTAADDRLFCPYCGEPVGLRGNLIVGRCDHLALVKGNPDGTSTATFEAPDEFLVPDTNCHRTGAWVYVTPDDPRYARAYEGGHREPGDPPPARPQTRAIEPEGG